MKPKPNHKIHRFENGSFTVARTDTGDTMHSRIGAWDEAQALYIEQSQLCQRLSHPHDQALVVWDVGMGIAANALGAFECAQKLLNNGQLRRSLVIHSFETEPQGLELALSEPSKFPFIERNLEAVTTLLHKNKISIQTTHSNRATHFSIEWVLHRGDFFSHIEAPEQETQIAKPTLIYYDFYAPSSAPELWTITAFNRLKKACLPDSELYTYVSATPARAAMWLAGWHLRRGASTAAKQDTTCATLTPNAVTQQFAHDWWQHYQRSSKKIPLGFAGTEAQAAAALGLALNLGLGQR